MLPEGTIHLVEGKQLCDEQYASYRERSGYQRGFKAGIRHECLEWLNADSTTQLEKAKQAGYKEALKDNGFDTTTSSVV